MTIKNLKNHLKNILVEVCKNQTFKEEIAAIPIGLKTSKDIVMLYNFLQQEHLEKKKYSEDFLSKIFEATLTVDNII